MLTPFCNETEWEEKVKKLSRAEALNGEVEAETTATSVAAKTLCIPHDQVIKRTRNACGLSRQRLRTDGLLWFAAALNSAVMIVCRWTHTARFLDEVRSSAEKPSSWFFQAAACWCWGLCSFLTAFVAKRSFRPKLRFGQMWTVHATGALWPRRVVLKRKVRTTYVHLSFPKADPHPSLPTSLPPSHIPVAPLAIICSLRTPSKNVHVCVAGYRSRIFPRGPSASLAGRPPRAGCCGAAATRPRAKQMLVPKSFGCTVATKTLFCLLPCLRQPTPGVLCCYG